jgi:hypothetical protein
MLRIRIEIVPGGIGRAREVATAVIGNTSNLAPISDYEIAVHEGPNGITGARAWQSRGLIARHERHQSVWALVARVAVWAAAEAEKQD